MNTKLEIDEVLMKLDGYSLVFHPGNIAGRQCYYSSADVTRKFGDCGGELSIFVLDSNKTYAYCCAYHIHSIVNKVWSETDKKRWVRIEE